jgi:hypothetical protein
MRRESQDRDAIAISRQLRGKLEDDAFPTTQGRRKLIEDEEDVGEVILRSLVGVRGVGPQQRDLTH